MARPGVAGDELTMRAVADHFGVVINLVTADSFMWFLRYAPRQTRSGREVFLAHVAPYVYLPIRCVHAVGRGMHAFVFWGAWAGARMCVWM